MTTPRAAGSLQLNAGVRAIAIAASQLLNQASTLLVMVLAARGLAPHDYGEFALALATAMAVSLIPGVGLDWAAIRISGRHAMTSQRRANDTLFVGAWLKVGSAAAVSATLLLIGEPIAFFALHRPEIGLALLVGSLAAFAIALTNYSLSTLQARALETRFIALNLVASSIKIATFAAVPAAAGLTIGGAYVLYLAVLCLVAVICGVYALSDLTPSKESRRPIFDELIGYARWLTPAAILGTVLSSLDLYAVTFLGTSESLGRYAAARTLALGLGAVAIVTSSTLLPRASRIAERRALLRFAFMTEAVLVVFVALVGVGALVAPFVFRHALGAQYAEAVPAFRLLVAAFSIDVLACPAMLLVLVGSRPDLLTWANGIVLLVTGVAFAVLMPGHGATLAAGITLAARAMLAAGTVGAALYIYRHPVVEAMEEWRPEALPQVAGVGAK